MANSQRDPSKKQEGESPGTPASHQTQNSRQSMKNPPGSDRQPGGGPKPDSGSRQDRTGMGSSQGQDRGGSEREQDPPSAGTPDIERGGQPTSRDSLVNDPTGAFKERP